MINPSSLQSIWQTLRRWMAQLLVLLTLWLLPLRTLVVGRSPIWGRSTIASAVIPFPVVVPERFTEAVPQPEEADRRGMMVENMLAGDRPPEPGTAADSTAIPVSVSYLQEDLGDRTRYQVSLWSFTSSAVSGDRPSSTLK